MYIILYERDFAYDESSITTNSNIICLRTYIILCCIRQWGKKRYKRLNRFFLKKNVNVFFDKCFQQRPDGII